MVREPRDRRLVPRNRHDAFDDADRDLGLVERAALFDVELDVGMPGAAIAARLADAVRIAADPPDPISFTQPAIHDVELAIEQLAGDRAAAVEPVRERP